MLNQRTKAAGILAEFDGPESLKAAASVLRDEGFTRWDVHSLLPFPHSGSVPTCLLIWYGNIPEETEWYLVRQTGDWKWISIVLVAGNLLIPFCGLLPRYVKRQKWLLGFWAVWLLVMHWVDLYWIVMPSLIKDKLPPSFSSWSNSPFDIDVFQKVRIICET